MSGTARRYRDVGNPTEQPTDNKIIRLAMAPVNSAKEALMSDPHATTASGFEIIR